MSDTQSNGENASVRINGEEEAAAQAASAEPARPQAEQAPAAPTAAELAELQEVVQRLEADNQRLVSEVEEARTRVNKLAQAYQELNRDREEFKQRLTRERERMMDVERGNVALALLEAIDELDRCLGMSGQGDSPLMQGVRLIRDGLLSKVQGMGMERLQVVGLPYDPNTAEATDMEITTNPEEDQKVVAEARAGYRMKERIVRPARVKVARYVAPAQA
jgi:molecular chaperone GrpE